MENLCSNFSEIPELSEYTASLFQDTVEQSPLSIFWLNQDGKFSYVNKQAHESLGYTREELLSLHLWDIAPNFYQERWAKHWKKMEKVQKRVIEAEHKRKDGHIFPIEVTVYKVNKSFHMAFVRDLTERVQSKKKTNSLMEQLQQAQKLESIGSLAGGIAHDFNNMLSVILGSSELLRLKLDRSESNVIDGKTLEKYLMQIEGAANRSKSITRQILSFSRKQAISPVSININNQIQNIIKILGRLIGEQIELDFNAGDKIGFIKIDPSQFDQILINLAVNARDAMHSGGNLRISTSNEIIENPFPQSQVNTSSNNYVLLSVKDNGVGMNEEVLSQVFDPFFTTKEQEKGTGLGLATIYNIIKLNNGIIDIQSEPGKGSAFNIYFPITKDDAKQSKIINTPINKQKGNIVLVEDEKLVRNLTSKMLRIIGYNVTSISNPIDAIEFFQTNKDQVDLLFTDIVMPKISGIELCDQVKKIRPDIKVLLMSAYSAELDDKKPILLKDMHFIDKPFKMKELASKIYTILKNSSEGKEEISKC
jgi:PAS domain S-box-containing protein